MFGWRKVTEGLIWLGLLTPLVLYGSYSLRRPDRKAITHQPLFQGIVYSRQVKDQPRPQIIHIFDIDLTTPGVRPYTTPGYEGAEPNRVGLQGRETLAQRTSDFLQTHNLQLAVNANFFFPFRELTPWNYSPRSDQPINISGLAMSDGELVSILKTNRPTLCFIEQRAVIRDDGSCHNGTQQAVAGNLPMLANGEPTDKVKKRILVENNKPYPFTVAALDADGTRLWLVLADGKQPLYAEGITLQEITNLVKDLGADTAIRLDGGGSTTGAISTPKGPKVLNVPIQAKIPGRERPVANHLGFFAKPLEP
ncbi:phosphodiester glycosidase family protein [Leptothoe spongobia]|uniref:Phosphodiester glycosidase family protein n=1 Tax=Leptothoe spongobia TAU-MAC 1115 TaxID=1967444 RepID=A0A947DKH6_9CYAN|nr:phosphodiester glycosidase family protein [Leptothoe spongobia]MBT9318004.1 phosphodiester glycosidase family protein [Leptothoe spongobia TAU-MAC 1115]